MESDMAVVREAINSALSLRADFNLRKVKTHGMLLYTDQFQSITIFRGDAPNFKFHEAMILALIKKTRKVLGS